MPRVGLDKEKVIIKAAQIADEKGLSNLSLKVLAQELGIKSPSLYKHISGIEELHTELMIYGWKQLELAIIDQVMGKAKDEAVHAMCDAYYYFAMEHPGVYESMQWYNRYSSEKNKNATDGIYKITGKIFEPYYLTKEQRMHLVRTFRGFLQGYLTIAIHNGFGATAPVKDSFDVSVDILVKGINSMAGEK